MDQVDLVVRRGKVVTQGGRRYTEGQTFRAPPGRARVWVKIGRAQVDPAGRSVCAVEDLPQPTRADLRDVLREERVHVVADSMAEPAESCAERAEDEAAERLMAPGEPETPPAAPAVPATRRRKAKSRETAGEQA